MIEGLVGVAVGIGVTRLVDRWRGPRHTHQWSAWTPAKEVTARNSFSSTVSLVQQRTCEDATCGETETRSRVLAHSS